jgi:hypothetical protein
MKAPATATMAPATTTMTTAATTITVAAATTTAPATAANMTAITDEPSSILFPGGTSLRDYPDAHLHDENDENNPIIIDLMEDEDGQVQLELPIELPVFERNSVKVDPFHAMKGYKDTSSSAGCWQVS